jgi:SAM-dependent methyltransferase
MQQELAIAHNFPTVSDPTAMRDFPDARNNERDTLLEYVALRPGMTVLDIQSAGGYLSDEIDRRMGGVGTVVCVEPNPALRARLKPHYVKYDDAVEDFRSVADNSMDVSLGLVGLHHSNSHRDTISEAFRVTKPGGEFAVCDVPYEGRLADWLNVFVARHCPSGHDGNFPKAGSVAQLSRDAGFVEVIEELRSVPWKFNRRADVAPFFRGLFGLDLDVASIEAALDDYFVIREDDGVCWVDWCLVYAHARKPG